MPVPPANDRVYSQSIERLRFPERIDRLEVERVARLCLDAGNISTLLDIGTGSGLFAERFFKAGVTVAGVDTNPDMIDAAKGHLPDGEFIVAPAEGLPFADGSFDATFFGVVFHEVSDYAQAMREAYRVSRHLTCILEWRHKREEFGPPLEHRLTEESIRNLARSAGYRSCDAVPLETLTLYKMHK
jgi:ubiquinone/menaquinone biosynthesis C-methylase UbiE